MGGLGMVPSHRPSAELKLAACSSDKEVEAVEVCMQVWLGGGLEVGGEPSWREWQNS